MDPKLSSHCANHHGGMKEGCQGFNFWWLDCWTPDEIWNGKPMNFGKKMAFVGGGKRPHQNGNHVHGEARCNVWNLPCEGERLPPPCV